MSVHISRHMFVHVSELQATLLLDELAGVLRDEGSVLVHCISGVNRSASVNATMHDCQYSPRRRCLHRCLHRWRLLPSPETTAPHGDCSRKAAGQGSNLSIIGVQCTILAAFLVSFAEILWSGKTHARTHAHTRTQTYLSLPAPCFAPWAKSQATAAISHAARSPIFL